MTNGEKPSPDKPDSTSSNKSIPTGTEPEEAEPEQASGFDEPNTARKNELASVVWGKKNKLKEDRPITYELDDSTFTINLVRKGVISVNEVETDEPPFLASVGPGTGFIRMGHIRKELPIILRFPRPVLTYPGSTFECFSTYPTRPTLYYEKEDGTTMKLLELPGVERKKSTYGSLTDAVVTYLHHGEHAIHPDDLPDDPLNGVVQMKLENKSSDPQEVSILLLDPGRIDFYSREDRLCLGKIHLEVLTEEQAEVHYRDKPSLEDAVLVDRHSEQETHSKALNMLRSIIGERSMSGGY